MKSVVYSLARFGCLMLLLSAVTELKGWAQQNVSALAAGAEVAAPNGSPDGEAVPINAFAQPAFPGGQPALLAFLNKNLRYPEAAQHNGIQGRVMVTFWVDEQGRTYGFGALQAPDESLGAEAVRVAKLMPSWTPGRQDGRIQPMMVYMPVSFKLAGR